MLRKKIFKSSLVGILFICLAGFSYAKDTQKQQFEFAKMLADEGDYASAILEYKRFIYFYPKHKLSHQRSKCMD